MHIQAKKLFGKARSMLCSKIKRAMFRTFGTTSLPEINDKAPKNAIEKWKASAAVVNCQKKLYQYVDPTAGDPKTYLQQIFETAFPSQEDQDNDFLINLTIVVVERMLDPKIGNVNMPPDEIKTALYNKEVSLLI